MSVAGFLGPAFFNYATATETEVRVRLKRALSVVQISGVSLRVSAPSMFLQVEARSGLRTARIRALDQGRWSIQWNGEDSPEQITAERLWVRGDLLRVGVEPTPYDLEIFRGAHRGLDVIARLDLETYLLGVLPAEMPISWPLESLKAQVVAARSFALRQARVRRKEPFDVEATISDQVYRFLGEVKRQPELELKLKRAVEETRGQVLRDHRRKILMAYYSADCGCRSENPKFVWGDVKHRVEAFDSVRDPSCDLRRPTSWTIRLGREEVHDRILTALNLPAQSSLKALHVGGRTPSGRVARVAVSLGVDGQPRRSDLSAQEFRRAFGYQRIQSADFSMRWFGDELQIVGRGSGHGVGLCQRGARSLAESGRTYREILKTYYPRASLD